MAVFGALCTAAVFQQKQARRWQPKSAPAGTIFVGDQACADCHKSEVESQRKTLMGRAMESVDNLKILSAHQTLNHRLGPYSYAITRKDKQSFYTVTDGTDTISLPIKYAFGQGKAGQTYVLEYEGALYESLLSYYNEIDGLDFTIGAQRGVPASLRAAIGRQLSKDEVVSCFACHATGAVVGGKLQLDTMTPGIKCETCHGPGGEHIAAVKNGEPGAASVFNPKRLGGDELTQEFCAACHRGNDEFTSLKGMMINNVRFQPYRIYKSSCYSDDHRISCEACHNPHVPLVENMAAYDSKCLTCHVVSAKSVKAAPSSGKPFASACKVANSNCASCHMPKVELPGAHFKFTDHYIRIAKPGAPFPN